jgi:hypothetical protein
MAEGKSVFETTVHKPLPVEERLRLFDETTRRIRRREWKGKLPKNRGWTREDLYERARHR